MRAFLTNLGVLVKEQAEAELIQACPPLFTLLTGFATLSHDLSVSMSL